MIKRLFLAWKILFICGVAYSAGPAYNHKDPVDQLEFENVYQDLRQCVNKTSATVTFISGSTITATSKIMIPDGTVTSPGLSFSAANNTDNGMYRIGNDDWAFAASGARVLEMTNSGQILKPLQPSFLVTSGAGQTDVTGDGTAYTVTWETEVYDQSSNFASNTFTAPVTGKYFLDASVFLRQLTASNTPIVVSIVTTAREYRQTYTGGSSFTGLPVHVSCLADMSVGQTATVVITVSGATKIIDVDNDAKQNYFSGTLIN